jgi:SAM-dependent methyltransferase
LCHPSVFDFFHAQVSRPEIEGKRVLEVGSRDVNGTVRPFLLSLGASEYLGVDLEPGPGVDRLCNVETLASELAGERFDVVVTTEMLEHVRDWRLAVGNLKRVVAPEGLLLVTTRSFGFPYHDYPGDYWRYEVDDMREIFRDLHVLSLLPDPQFPGVFLKGRKPADFHEVDVSQWNLFSVVKAERASAVDDEEVLAYAQRMKDLTEIGRDVTRILRKVDLTDVGQRHFRALWQSFERLGDQLRRLARREADPAGGRVFARFERRLLEWMTASRLARGGAFVRARRKLLRSASATTGIDAQRVPWAAVDEQRFQEILTTLESVHDLCEKIESYARPAPPVS